MSELIGVGEAARRLGARPYDITKMFYDRELRDDIAPLVAGKRVIPVEYLETIRAALRRKGRPVAQAVVNAG